jgi:hypothetical protein
MPSRYDESVYGVDAVKDGFVMDFRPTTLLEQSMMGGDRINLPAGNATAPRPEIQTTGGRGTTDAVTAQQIGAQGRK